MIFGIIAAGEGSRLAQAGIKEPKPLVKIKGECLIDRLIRIFSANNAEKIYVICNEQMTDVQKWLDEKRDILQKDKGVELRVVEKTTPSSMHSFYELSKAMREEAGKFILTTVDTIFDETEFADYVKRFESDEKCDGIMGLTQFIDDEKPLYVGVEGDKITGYYDTKNDCNHISAGIYGLTQKSFAIVYDCIASGQSRMRNFQRALVAQGLNLKPFVFSDVFDIDRVEDLQKANSL